MLLGAALTYTHLKTDLRYAQRDNLTYADLSSYSLEQRSTTDLEATKIVNGIKDEYGNGISVLLRIFNATGERLTFVSVNQSTGGVWKYPYDTLIDPGQWSVVLYAHPEGKMLGAIGGIVYRATESKEDIYLGWDVPFWAPGANNGGNKVYAEVRSMNHFESGTTKDHLISIANSKALALCIEEEKDSRGQVHPMGLKVVGQCGSVSSPLMDYIIGRNGILK